MNQKITIESNNFQEYSNEWEIEKEYQDLVTEIYCERSGQNIERCENKECAEIKSHKSRPRQTLKKLLVLIKKI